MKNLHAIVLGATGATGQEIVRLLLKDTTFSKISIFVRRKPNIEHDKLIVHEINFSRLIDYRDLINGDILFSALGTTLKEAGSKQQQYLVDYTYQHEFAKMAADNGVTHYSLVSSTGADKKSFFFYPKIKGALEESVKKLKFEKIQIFQPPALIRQPERLNKIGLLISLKPLSVSVLAEKMIMESKSDKTVELKTYKPKDLI
jgi:uncharacterized protein YbjT (DUF2867 family)